MAKFDIIPEYSFVLGTPADTPEQVMKQIDQDIAFIKEIKRSTQKRRSLFMYIVRCLLKVREMYNKVLERGFRFPEKLEDWISPHWENLICEKTH